MTPMMLARRELQAWLREEDPVQLARLYAEADRVRCQAVGAAVHLRGLVEISNHCRRQCWYCGIRQSNRRVPRYRMTADEILDCGRLAVKYNYGTLVLQAGEDPGITPGFIAEIICRIKEETPLAVTLSLGERSVANLRAWRAAGADRYLLRFETSDMKLYRRIHPDRQEGAPDRLSLLGRIRALGYETGSGVMVGIPGQSYASVADDLLLFRKLGLDMIGVGPFIPHPTTPLAKCASQLRAPAAEQVPADEATIFKVLALARLISPNSNIPATTGLATINPGAGRVLGLQRGANVIMPNLTPRRYRQHYEIYPGKAGSLEDAAITAARARTELAQIGRPPGRGPGRAQQKGNCAAPPVPAP